MQITKPKLSKGTIFVYNTNQIGLHRSYSARVALLFFGATEGTTGHKLKSYGVAIASCLKNKLDNTDIANSMYLLYKFIRKNPTKKFHLGFSYEDLTPKEYADLLFITGIPKLDNVIIPDEIKEHLAIYES